MHWKVISGPLLHQFLTENGFGYMFFNSYIYKPYLKKLDRYALHDEKDDKIMGAVMIENIIYNQNKDKNVIHFAFLPEIRGKIVKEMCEKWLSLYLATYKVLEGHIPKKWPQAIRFAKWFKWEKIDETSDYLIVEVRNNDE